MNTLEEVKEYYKEMKAYWRVHPEQKKAWQKVYDRAYYLAHKEDKKAWRESHKEEYKAYQRAYREAHKKGANHA
jgi:hypothetical protein